MCDLTSQNLEPFPFGSGSVLPPKGGRGWLLALFLLGGVPCVYLLMAFYHGGNLLAAFLSGLVFVPLFMLSHRMLLAPSKPAQKVLVVAALSLMGMWSGAIDPAMLGSAFDDARVQILTLLFPVALALRLAFGRNVLAPYQMARSYQARVLLWLAGFLYVGSLFFGIRSLEPLLMMLVPLLIVVLIGYLPLKMASRGFLAAGLLGFLLLLL